MDFSYLVLTLKLMLLKTKHFHYCIISSLFEKNNSFNRFNKNKKPIGN